MQYYKSKAFFRCGQNFPYALLPWEDSADGLRCTQCVSPGSSDQCHFVCFFQPKITISFNVTIVKYQQFAMIQPNYIKIAECHSGLCVVSESVVAHQGQHDIHP